MIFVIGGARSGKSSYAEKRIKEMDTYSEKVLYIATSLPTDGEMEHRIRNHQESRPQEWKTLEQFKGFENLVEEENFNHSNIVLVDCITIMITNLMFDFYTDFDTITNEQIDQLEIEIENEIIKLFDICQQHKKSIFIVSNEVGYGLVPSYRLGRIFRDIAGRMNQMIASRATEVVLVTAGIPLRIK